ncbi:MAG: flagellar protein FlaG [Deltaproteobacteria bacterium]|nr:flagellar protein FlaG [Deltaproteobacteria bacterium]
MEAVGSVKSSEIQGITAIAPLKGAESVQSHQAKTRERSQSAAEKQQVAQAQVERDNRAKIERIAQVMDDYVKSMQRSLNIQVNSETGRVVVRVISEEDGRTIREIPPEEVLNLAAKMEEMMGLLFNERV